jgi:hypothetical protein
MTILLPYRIRRSFIQQHTEWIFVFGSDYYGKSFFGQAYEALNEPNAYGVPTIWKLCPSGGEKHMYDSSFFKGLVNEKLNLIPMDGRPIIPFPKIGQGHSQMHKTAPMLYSYMMDRLSAIAYPYIEIDYKGLVYPIYTHQHNV